MEKNKRLTDEELTAIRERAEKVAEGNPLVDIGALIRKEEVINEDIPKLLAEIERLRELLNKAFEYGTSSDAYRDEKVIEELYEYLYGGDVE